MHARRSLPLWPGIATGFLCCGLACAASVKERHNQSDRSENVQTTCIVTLVGSSSGVGLSGASQRWLAGNHHVLCGASGPRSPSLMCGVLLAICFETVSPAQCSVSAPGAAGVAHTAPAADPLRAPAAPGLTFQLDGDSWGCFQDPVSEVTARARLSCMSQCLLACNAQRKRTMQKQRNLPISALCAGASEAVLSQSCQERVAVERSESSSVGAGTGEDSPVL